MLTGHRRISALWSERLEGALLAPIRAMRMRYLPLLMVYFAYGALGLTGIAKPLDQAIADDDAR